MALTLSGSTDTGYGVAADTNGVRININGSTKATFDASGNMGIGVTPQAWKSTQHAIEINPYGAISASDSTSVINVSANTYLGSDGNWKYTASSLAATLYQQASGIHYWNYAASGTAGNTITFTTGMKLDASGRFIQGGGGSVLNTCSASFYQLSGDGGAMAIKRAQSTEGVCISFHQSSGTQTGYIYNYDAGGTSYVTSSDYRLKDNPQPLSGSGAFIDALQPKAWDWKSNGSRGVGFIAHEVQAVSPSSVVGKKDAVDDDGNPVYQAMEYGSAEFIANIVAELQSVRKRLAALEAK